MVFDCERHGGSQAYVVGASKERLPAIRDRLRREGVGVSGHCDHPRQFSPPRGTAFVLLIADMGSHAALDKARSHCRATGLPCVGGLWRTWSVTRQRLAEVVATYAAAPCATGSCPLGRDVAFAGASRSGA